MHTRNVRSIRLAPLSAAAFAAALAVAAPAALAGERRPPHGPPPEAIAACAGKAAAAACEVALGDRTEAGTCAAFDGATLACRPTRMPPHPHGPPPEAIEACSGLAEGATCAVTLGGDTLDGTCARGPGGDALACRPAGLPPPPEP